MSLLRKAGIAGGLERESTADCLTPGVSEFLCGEFKVLLNIRGLMLSEADWLQPVVWEGLLNYY